MDKPLLVLAAIYALGLIYVVLPVVVEAWLRYRKSRQVTCPEEKIAAAITIDARAAAVAAAKGKTRLEILNCSLWPKKSGCSQRCLEQTG